MSSILLKRIKKNKETQKEEEVVFNINSKDIACLYKDRNGVFIINRQGFMNKVPYTLEEIKEALEM